MGFHTVNRDVRRVLRTPVTESLTVRTLDRDLTLRAHGVRFRHMRVLAAPPIAALEHPPVHELYCQRRDSRRAEPDSRGL
jgi:hypothetical protein